jgi:hypothetical protein
MQSGFYFSFRALGLDAEWIGPDGTDSELERIESDQRCDRYKSTLPSPKP